MHRQRAFAVMWCGGILIASLGGCGGDGAKPAGADRTTSYALPTFEANPDQRTVRVTDSGITDPDGVRDLSYTLTDTLLVGSEYVSTSPIFENVAYGSYTLKVKGEAFNRATGRYQKVENFNTVQVDLLPPDVTPPAKTSESLAPAFTQPTGQLASGTVLLSESLLRVGNPQIINLNTGQPVSPAPLTLTVTINADNAKTVDVRYTIPLTAAWQNYALRFEAEDSSGNTAAITSDGYNLSYLNTP